MRTSVRFLVSILVSLALSIVLGHLYQGSVEYGVGLGLWFALTVLVVYATIFKVSEVNTAQILNVRTKTSTEDMLFRILKNMTIFYLLSMLFLVISYWFKDIDVFGYVFRYDYFTLSFVVLSMIYTGSTCIMLTKFNANLENKIKEEQLNK